MDRVYFCKTCNTEVPDGDSLASHRDAGCELDHEYCDKHYGMEIARMLAEEVNHANPIRMAEGMVAEMNRTHRYLQAEVVTVLVAFIERYADLTDNQQDGRNAGAVGLCRKLREAI